MSHIGIWRVPYVDPGAGNSRSVEKITGINIGAGASLAVPHNLGLHQEDYPGAPATVPLVVNTHLRSAGLAANPIQIDSVDDSQVVVTNLDGGNPLDLDIWLWMPPWWAGLFGDGTEPRNWYSEEAPLALPGPTAYGPAELHDEHGVPPAYDAPDIMGHIGVAPGGWGAAGGDFTRWPDPPHVPNPVLANDSGVAAIDLRVMMATCHSLQRVWPGVSGIGDVLMASVGPLVIAQGAGPVAFAHGLTVGGVAVEPDLAWLIPIGVDLMGNPLVGPNNCRLTAFGSAPLQWSNENPNPGEDICAYAKFVYVHSAHRIT